MNTKFLLLTIAVIAAPLIAMLFSTFDLYSRCDDSLQTQVKRMSAEGKVRDIDFGTCNAAKAVTNAYVSGLK